MHHTATSKAPIFHTSFHCPTHTFTAVHPFSIGQCSLFHHHSGQLLITVFMQSFIHTHSHSFPHAQAFSPQFVRHTHAFPIPPFRFSPSPTFSIPINFISCHQSHTMGPQFVGAIHFPGRHPQGQTNFHKAPPIFWHSTTPNNFPPNSPHFLFNSFSTTPQHSFFNSGQGSNTNWGHFHSFTTFGPLQPFGFQGWQWSSSTTRVQGQVFTHHNFFKGGQAGQFTQHMARFHQHHLGHIFQLSKVSTTPPHNKGGPFHPFSSQAFPHSRPSHPVFWPQPGPPILGPGNIQHTPPSIGTQQGQAKVSFTHQGTPPNNSLQAIHWPFSPTHKAHSHPTTRAIPFQANCQQARFQANTLALFFHIQQPQATPIFF